jgi:hypothetical protein
MAEESNLQAALSRTRLSFLTESIGQQKLASKVYLGQTWWLCL